DSTTWTLLGPLLVSHKAVVNDVAFSPDGKTLASGSDDHTIQWWDVKSRTLLDKPHASHDSEVACLAFSLDGKLVASGCYDNTTWLWDVATGDCLGRLQRDKLDVATSLEFLPDG
ncbi:hypothetical protein M407DRAFT_47733, partial [Tulasnella calospora MUT 4182]